jgi:homoserine kinase type II
MPVPEPLVGTEGYSILRLSGRLVEVDPLVEHDAMADTWERYSAAFFLLARLHDTLTDVVPATLAPPRVSNYGTPPQLRCWTEKTRAMIELDAGEPDAAEALALTGQAQDLLRVIDSWWREAKAGLPRQPIHGDYGGGNVLFRGQEIVAVLDFDFLGVRERVYELAYTTFWMLRRLMPDASPAAYPWSAVRDLLGVYQQATQFPITSAEWEALPLEMARVPLYWVAEAGFTDDPVQSVLGIGPMLEITRWLLEHAHEFTIELLSH